MGHHQRVLIAMFIACTTLFISGASKAEDAGKFSLIYGDVDAPLSIIEFTDYQCPVCKVFHPKVVSYVHTDKRLKLDVKEIAILGPQSVNAAYAAFAATNQNKRKAMHEGLMSYRGSSLSDRIIFGIAAYQGVHPDILQKDIDTDRFDKILAANLKIGLSYRITGTPAFLIDGTFLQGPTLEQIKDVVNAALSKRGL